MSFPVLSEPERTPLDTSIGFLNEKQIRVIPVRLVTEARGAIVPLTFARVAHVTTRFANVVFFVEVGARRALCDTCIVVIDKDSLRKEGLTILNLVYGETTTALVSVILARLTNRVAPETLGVTL